jgi:NADP-dependent 3-hydroxy acid dehydrogenase YdfG
VQAFGTVHILLNNAGILRDISFKNQKQADWDLIMKVHVEGSYKVSTRGVYGEMEANGEGIVCESCLADNEEAEVWKDNQHDFRSGTVWKLWADKLLW